MTTWPGRGPNGWPNTSPEALGRPISVSDLNIRLPGEQVISHNAKAASGQPRPAGRHGLPRGAQGPPFRSQTRQHLPSWEPVLKAPWLDAGPDALTSQDF